MLSPWKGHHMKVRWCIQSDLDYVVAIERRSHEYPLEYDDFWSCLKRDDHVGLVVENDRKIVGFLLYQIKKDHYRVVSMAVDPDRRREGAGSSLLSYLKRTAKGRMRMVVSDTKVEVHCFLKANGLLATKVLHEHFGPQHDGYEFVYDRKIVTTKRKKSKNNVAEG